MSTATITESTITESEPTTRSENGRPPGGSNGGPPEAPSSSHADDTADVDVFVLDTDGGLLENCERVLSSEGYGCRVESDPQAAVDHLARKSYDVVLVDRDAPGVDVLELVRELRKRSNRTLPVIMSDDVSVNSSREAMDAGAWDYFPKPFSAGQLLALLGRASYTVDRTRALENDAGSDGLLLDNGLTILGVSEALKSAVRKAIRVANTGASVLLAGESGTGKELFARLIHEKSRREQNEFVPVNCAALPGELLESEMFGHREGAFTGAVREKPGLLETADEGTLFLDELTEMSPGLQAKLLRVIQDGAVRRVGSEEVDSVVDVRFISATNREVESALKSGKLRDDLYYRLRTVPIRLPPLRNRPEDIPVLARHFIVEWWEQYRGGDGPPPSLSPEALDALVSYPWPGNVRELENLVEQAVIFAEPDQPLGVDDLPLGEDTVDTGSVSPSSTGWAKLFDFDQSYHNAKDEVIARFEREYLTRIVVRADGNLSEAARESGVDRTTLYRLMEKHDLSRDSFME